MEANLSDNFETVIQVFLLKFGFPLNINTVRSIVFSAIIFILFHIDRIIKFILKLIIQTIKILIINPLFNHRNFDAK